MKQILVLYHGPNCDDGFGSAFVAWLKFKDTAEYVEIGVVGEGRILFNPLAKKVPVGVKVYYEEKLP